MKWAKGWRLYASVAAAVTAVGLLVASAGGAVANVQYGVSAAKGCNPQAFVGQPDVCLYSFVNVTAVGIGRVPSTDTVTVNSAEDVVAAAGGNVSSGNIFSLLKLVYSPAPGNPGAPTCQGLGMTGTGTLADPVTNATSCTLPYGAGLSSLDFNFYTVQPADVTLPGQILPDQVTWLWQDLCDNTPDPGTCNPNSINKAQAPSSTAVVQYQSHITTLLSSGQIIVGGSVHDTATITFPPPVPPAPPGVSGTVTYKVYTDATCTTLSTNPAVNATVNYNGGAVPNSPNVVFPAAGSFWWTATFSGDFAHGVAGSTSGCSDEPLVVGPLSPTLTTQASATQAAPATLTDVATLAGASANATGTITFHLYSNNTCTTEVTGSPVTATVNGSGNYTSPGITVQNAGTYWWRDSYSGDANNNAIGLTPCNVQVESTVVTAAQPALTTNASGGGNVPVNVTDVAHLTGATANATGTITYHLYSNTTCTTEVSGSPVTTGVNGSGDYTSPSITLTTAGTYFWRDSYSGDANNAAIPLTACGAPNESVTVTTGGGGGGGTPAISITKNPKQQQIPSGSTANFTIVVTNTGTLTLTNVTVSDPLAPGCNRTSADIPALASMAPGASVTYNCSLSNVTAAFTNVATATGTGSNGQTVTATDTAPVTVTTPLVPPTTPTTPTPAPTPKPAIDIIKDPNSQTIGVGGTATFKITVTNTGNTTLSDVTVTDPLSPDCDRNLGTLAVGQSKSYTCSRKNVPAPFQNVATASGKPPTGARVQANDNANVKVQAFAPPQNPKIAIVKSPKQQQVTTKLETSTTASGEQKTKVTYGDAHFTIKVTNTGNVTLHSVHVADPASPGCVKDLGTLAPGQSKTYNCTKATVSSNFHNVATATGLSPKGKKVTAQDHADVTVKVKTASTSGAKFTG